MATVSADRISGAATLYNSSPWDPPALASISSIQTKSTRYGSDPWWPSAQASISSIQMTTLSSKAFKTASDFNGPLSKLAVYQKTTVPANFSLSFDIKPFKTVSRLASIIHYCKNNTDIENVGRMPGMYWKLQLTYRL